MKSVILSNTIDVTRHTFRHSAKHNCSIDVFWYISGYSAKNLDKKY